MTLRNSPRPDWAERLAVNRAQLSRREVDLIRYITNHPQQVAFLKQHELIEAANVSKPVVISCFRRLGYNDYQDFLEGIQNFYAGQIDSAQASTMALKDVQSVSDLINLALEVEANTLATLRRYLDPADLEALARALLSARATYFYAEGTGFTPAHYLAKRLRRCGLSVYLVTGDRAQILDDLGPLGPNDMLLTFFYTQDKDVVLRLFEHCRSRRAATALITGALDPELYDRADYHIFVPRGQWNFKNSMAAPLTFAQILLLTVELLGGAELQLRLKNLEATRKGFVSEKKEEES